MPFICSGKEQTVRVTKNGKFCKEVTFQEQKISSIEIEIDHKSCDPNNGGIVLGLELPHATSPKACGISDDSRLLGIFLMNFSVSQKA